MILIRGAILRAARTASKPDYLVFGSAFGFEALAIPLCTGGGPLPGRHCSVLLVVRPGDLLLPDEEEIGTFYRHLDPKTSSKRHEEEAANVLSFQRPCRLVAWAIVVEASTHPFRRRHVLRMLMQKLPDILKEEVSGTGLLAVNAFAWSLEHLDDVHRSYDPLIVENPKMFAGEKVADKSGSSGPKLGKKARGSSGSTPTRMASKAAIERLKAAEREIKKLREEKLVAEKRLEFQTARNHTIYGVVTSAVNKLTTVAEGVTHHEQTSGRSIQMAVDAMRAVVQEVVSYRGSTLEFMNTQWLPTVQALHLTATAAQGRRREDDLLLFRGVADALGKKIKTVVSAEVKAAMEGEAQRIAAAVTAKVVQELMDDLVKAVTSATQQGIGTAGFSLLPTALASVMHGGRATAEESPDRSAERTRRATELRPGESGRRAHGRGIRGREAGLAANGGPASTPRGQSGDYTRRSTERRHGPDGRRHARRSGGRPGARGARCGPACSTLDEYADCATDRRHSAAARDLLRPAAVVGQQGGPPGAGQQLHPSTSTPTAQDARPAGVTALVDELLRPAAVVGQQGGPPGTGQYPPTATIPATAQDARPAGATALVDELLRPASVVGQHVQQAAAGQHPHTATSPATARDARPGGVTALVDELLRPAAVVGQHVQQAAAGQHPHTATSPATARDARPGCVTALVDELLRPPAVVGQHVQQAATSQHPHTATSQARASTGRPGGVTAQLVDQSFRPDLRATNVPPSGAVEATSVIVSTTTAAPTKSGTARATLSLPNPPPPTTGTAGAASLPVHGAMVAAEPIPIPTVVESRAVEALITQKPSFDEYLKWLEDQGQKTPVIPPTHSNQAVDQGAEAANVAAATAGPSGSTVEAAVWRAAEEAGGVDEEILASIVMPDPEIEVMREKLQAAAPTVGAQQGAPAATTAPAEDHSAAGAKSPPATTGEVGDGKQKRKGKDKAKGGPAKVGSSKGTSKAAAQGRKGSGVRVDPSNELAVSEMKFGKKSRYICRSMDKSEAAYCIAVAVSSFDGFVSDVVLDEFGGVKEEVMAQYKADWNVARLISGGMWSRGANVFRDRITGADRAALMLALRPAVWFGDLPESTEPEKAAKNKVASDMIARVSMCAAFAPVAAKVTPIPGVGSERLSEILAGTAAALWCFSDTNATAEVAAGKGGAAATVRGASNEFASRCRTVIEAVLQRAASRWEVAKTVTKDLQAAVVRSLPEVEEEREHDELIARVMIENLAFWGDCNVGGPKLKARGVDLPIDPQMKIIIRDRGARGQQHKGKQVADA
ncbi:unnamed protein product [Closterium sp. NIES-64]|nr:unnamed protein product [Closterium sp. NIES-64]